MKSETILAVYANLMQWRKLMYMEQREDKDNSVMGIAGEAWHWGTLTEGDLKFIEKEAAKLEGI